MSYRRDELESMAALEPPDELDAIVLERAHGVLEALETSRPATQQNANASYGSGVLLSLRRALR